MFNPEHIGHLQSEASMAGFPAPRKILGNSVLFRFFLVKSGNSEKIFFLLMKVWKITPIISK